MPTPHHRLSSVLAARTQHRQVDVVYRADQAAVGVDRAIGSVWQQLLAVLKTDHGWAVNYQRVRHVLQRLQPVLQQAVAKRLEAQAVLGHQSAAKVLAQTLPLEYLRAAAPIPVEAVESRHGLEDVLCATVDLDCPTHATRTNRGSNPASIAEDVVSSHARAIEELTHAQVTESTDATLLVPRDSAGGAVGAAVPVPDVLVDRPGDVKDHDHALAGDESRCLDSDRTRLPALRLLADADACRQLAEPGVLPLVQLTEDETDPDPGPEPTVPEPSGDALRRLFQALLFPPPPVDLVRQIVFGSISTATQSWPQRIASLSRLAPPEVLATTVANGFAQGLSQRAIAELLEPMVNNVRASARRIARTEGLRVSAAVQMRCHEQLGDLVIGFQVFATLDFNTRSWHAARSGTVYFKEPGPGQKGPAQQPHPPEEAADASERPAGTPQVAPNCRCHLSPVMRPQEDILADPAKMAVFHDNASKVVPDPEVYSDWFSKVDARRQRIAVGTKRHAWAVKEFGENFGWETFIGPKGNLLSLKALKAESDLQRGKRIAKVRALMAQRRELIRQNATYGFLLPSDVK